MSVALIVALLTSTALARPRHAPAAPADASPTSTAASTEPAVPRLTKQAIGTCGCAVYAPEGLQFGPAEKSEDGADVWQGQVHVGDYDFGVVAVKFSSPFNDPTADLEGLLTQYMDFLKTQFDVSGAVGYGHGHTLASNPAAKGVIDFWQVKDGTELAVAGWVDPTRLAVLFVHGKGDYPLHNVQQLFFDGFRFEP